ncbi:MAG: hypothetical protein QXI61_05755 [Nitrososphaerota archaeon]
MNRTYTLRDLRRLAARDRVVCALVPEDKNYIQFNVGEWYIPQWELVCCSPEIVRRVYARFRRPDCEWIGDAKMFSHNRGIYALIDYLISCLGAQHPVERGRPSRAQDQKGTQEVAQPSSANQKHGGSGSAKECQHAAQTPTQGGRTESSVGGMADSQDDHSADGAGASRASRNPRDRDHDSGRDGGGGGGAKAHEADPEGRKDASEASRGRNDGCEDESPDGEPTDRSGSTVLAPRPADGDRPELAPAVAPTTDRDAAAEDQDDAIKEPEGGDLNSGSTFDRRSPEDNTGLEDIAAQDSDDEPLDTLRVPITSFGGVYAQSDLRRAKKLSREARRVLELLRRLIYDLDIDSQGQPSPRYHSARFVKELVTKRYQLSRARREEVSHKTVLLLPDVSGSCSTVCEDTLAACDALALVNDRVRVIVHSNGWIYDRYTGQHGADITTAIDVRDISVAIALGDWDAGYYYQAICEAGAKFVWLDSYCAKHGVRPASKKLKEPAKNWTRQPVAWYQGVNGIIALRHALLRILKERARL